MTVFHAKRYSGAAKKSNRARLREAKFHSELGQKSYVLMLSILAQVGGDVTISKGTAEIVNRAISTGKMTFEMSQIEETGEYRIKLVTDGE
jgi:hypothetical protein